MHWVSVSWCLSMHMTGARVHNYARSLFRIVCGPRARSSRDHTRVPVRFLARDGGGELSARLWSLVSGLWYPTALRARGSLISGC